MDTNRIIINNYDLSTSIPGDSSKVTGFTVVKAPKGPATPVRISTNNAERIKDIFGVPSREYPDLFEVNSFNKEFDIYVSAPYASAKIPVAYVTHKGIFPGADLITYDNNIEEYVLGKYADTTALSSKFLPSGKAPAVLIDTRYPKSGLGVAEEDVDSKDAIPKYTNNAVKINLGVTMNEIGWTKDSLDFNTSEIELKPRLDYPLTSLRIYNIPGATLNYVDLSLEIVKDESGNKIIAKEGDAKVGHIDSSSDLLVLNISGAGTEDGVSEDTVLTKDCVTTTLSMTHNVEGLRSFWIYKLGDNGTTDNIFAALFPKFPSNRKLHFDFVPFDSNIGYKSSDATSRNLIKAFVYEDGASHNETRKIYIEASLDPESKTPGGAFNSFEASSDFRDQDILGEFTFKPITENDLAKFTANPKKKEDSKEKEASEEEIDKIGVFPSIYLEGGVRDTNGECSIASDANGDVYEKGWLMAKASEYSGVDLFFDCRKYDGVSQASDKDPFFTLAQFHKQSGFLFNQTLDPTTISSESTSRAIKQLTFGPQYWNLCNQAIVSLGSQRIISSMIGARARMQARIIAHREGGVAPMFINTGIPSCGGQLDIDILRLVYSYDKDQQTFLDKHNYNPVVNDTIDGTSSVMVTGHKTCKAGAITDWSFIGHVCSFLKLQKEIREQVMLPQIGKPNDDYYRGLRKQQVDYLLQKRTNGPQKIWHSASCDTSTAPGVNDIEALKMHRFIINVRVKVAVYSEEVVLNFINVAQDMEV